MEASQPEDRLTEVNRLRRQLAEAEAKVQLLCQQTRGTLRDAAGGDQAQEPPYRDFVEGTSDLVAQVDSAGRFTFVNRTAVQVFGLEPEACIGRSVYEFIHPDDRERTRDLVRACIADRVTQATIENRQVSTSGEVRDILWNIAFHFDPDRHPLYSSAIGSDITERKRIERRLASSLREKEVLLKEIHHRVKNDLQVVCSLLDLQADSARDPDLLRVCQDSQTRVQAMALVHETLYRSGDPGRIDMNEYIRTEVENLLEVYSGQARRVTAEVDADEISLDIDTAMPCGLIVNELVSNALKHAFPGDGQGTLWVSLAAQAEDRLLLVVRDDGVGLPPGLDLVDPPSLGLQLVSLLTQQLGGTITVRRDAGTAFEVAFPQARTHAAVSSTPGKAPASR